MPTYEYECTKCGLRFEHQQPIKDAPLEECPECGGNVHRLVSGGSGFIFKGSGEGKINQTTQGCSLTQTGRTCCGRDERCDTPRCGENE